MILPAPSSVKSNSPCTFTAKPSGTPACACCREDAVLIPVPEPAPALITPSAPMSKDEVLKSKARPVIKPVALDSIPERMKALPQWVLWRWELTENSAGGKRWTKVLKQPKLWENYKGDVRVRVAFAQSTNPNTWSDWETIVKAYEFCQGWQPGCYGIGFAIAEDDPVAVIDLDDVRNRDTGEFTAEADEIIRRFDTYSETSPSGTGAKLFILGRKPSNDRTKNTERDIEVFDRKRYVTVTGERLDGTPADLMPRQEELAAFYYELFPVKEKAERPVQADSDAELPPILRPCLDSDDEILDRIRRSKQAERFVTLWKGGGAAYALHGGDRSATDFALACMLAFWCGPDVDRIVNLMWQSGLRRGKWNRNDYLERTVQNAARRQTRFFGSPVPPRTPGEEVLGVADDLEELLNRIGEVAAEVVNREAAGAEARALAFRAIEEARRSHEADHGLRCPNLRPIILRDLDTQDGKIIWDRCREYETCDACHRWRVYKEMCNLTLHLSSAPELFEANVPAEALGALQRRLQRAGGEYAYVNEVCGGSLLYVIATKRFPGSVPVSAKQALSTAETLLREERQQDRQMGTSMNWCFPKEEKRPSRYERIGIAPRWLTMKLVRDIADAHGLHVKVDSPNDQQSSTVVATTIEVPNRDRDLSDHIIACLRWGEVLHYDGPAPEPKPPDPPYDDDAGFPD